MSREQLDALFEALRENPRAKINMPGRLTGKHCQARLQRAQAKRRQGRVKEAVRHREGRASFTP